MNRECSTPSKRWPVCAEPFTEDSLEQKFQWSLLGLTFKPRRLPFKTDSVPKICNFTVARCKPAIGQTNDEKQANNVPRTPRPFPK